MAMLNPDNAPPEGPYFCFSAVGCRSVPATMALEMPDNHQHGLVSDNFKIIHRLNRGTYEAYDLERDPAEQHPLNPVPETLRNNLSQWEEYLMGPRNRSSFWPYHTE